MASEGSLGLLSGLGGALQDIGSDVFKTALADDIEKQREARKEEREDRKLQRERVRNATTYDPKQDTPFTRDGVVMMQRHAIDGSPLDSVLANESQLQAFNAAENERKIKLEDLTTRANINKFKHDRLTTDAKQDDDMFAARLDTERSQAEANRARAAAAGRSGTGRRSLDEDDEPVTATDVADALVGEYEDQVEQYGLTPSQATDLAMSAIQDARASGKDPKDVFRLALPRYVDNMRAKGYKVGKKSGKTSLDLRN